MSEYIFVTNIFKYSNIFAKLCSETQVTAIALKNNYYRHALFGFELWRFDQAVVALMCPLLCHFQAHAQNSKYKKVNLG